jgi:hypothetical protein
MAMTLAGLDLVAVSRCLSQLVERQGDVVDAFFERQEVIETPADDRGAGLRARREGGFAVRLARGRRSWIATGDEFDAGRFHSALRQVARTWPQAAYPPPELYVSAWSERMEAPEVQRFPPALTRALRERLVAFPMSVRARRHRRFLQVVGPQLVPDAESERYYSIEVRTPFTTHGLLTTALDRATVDQVADSLTTAFGARQAAPPPKGRSALVLSPQAAAILLHEAVAHALEADTLAAGGAIEAAIGLEMGSSDLDILDDPTSAPDAVRRQTDDEGRAVERRWLLRGGVVEQPLADASWSQLSGALIPGACRRGDRNDPPSPRSSHLVLLPGEQTEEELMADGGIWVPEVSRGSLDVATGTCRLHVPFGARLEDGRPGQAVGAFVVAGRVADLLGAIAGVGSRPVETGAGWCAKGRQRVPVWATTPSLRLAEAEVAR